MTKSKAHPIAASDEMDWTYLYCGYNALVACAVLYEYTQNAEAAALEYLPDVAIHAFEALAPKTWNKAALLANAVRGLQAGAAFFSGHSTVPHLANGVDMVNHGVNMYHRISAGH